jgi:CHASE3 domain sensor protein
MQRIHKRSKRSLLIGFGFSLAILIISSVLSYFSIKQLIDSQQSVEHTVEVKEGLETLLSRMKDAETGQRGYLLTGDESFLEPFKGARNDVTDLFISVQILTGNNELQQSEFPKLQQLINDKFVIMNQTIADRRREILPSASVLLRGKAIMDSLRGKVNVMVQTEQALMVGRNARMDRFARLTPIAISIAALISMIITIVFYNRVTRDAKISMDLQRELQEKKERTSRQIDTIGDVARKISEGKYRTRIEDSDME